MAHKNETLANLRALHGGRVGKAEDEKLKKLAREIDRLRFLGLGAPQGYQIESPFADVNTYTHTEETVAVYQSHF